MKKIDKKQFKTLGKVLRYIGRYKFLLPISVLMALVSVAMTLYVPILIGDAIDLIVGKGAVDLDGVISLLLTSGILIGVGAMASWIMSIINNKIAFSVTRDMRDEAFEKLQTLPLSYVDRTPHGDTVNRVINDTDRFSEGLLLGFTQVFTGILTIVGTLGFMFSINWKIALVVLFLTPISIIIAKFIGSRTFNMFSARSVSEAEATSYIDEMIGNQKIVKAFGHEDEAEAHFLEVGKKLEKCTLKAIFFSSLTNPTTRFVNSLVYAAVALVGAFAVISSKDAAAAFTIGQFSCLLSYTNQYTKPFNEISGIIAEFQNALASVERVFALIEEPSELPDSENAVTLDEVSGTVKLDNVSFSYDKSRELIRDLDIDVAPGQRIAIVGPTGCGKTTLINLLMRFYDVDGGTISVEDNDIRNIKKHSLRASYGMVLQDTWLMEGTVGENIAFGKPDATEDEIIAAAKFAHAHSFIKRLPEGYNTRIGEGGEGLSQGQRQLVCIARVMLCLPPMLILDEATSSIDTRTEMRIQRAFNEMMEGRTSFIVAHRLSTIREADAIIVMKDGRIIETGKHDELLARGGFYSELYNSQFAH